MNEGALIMYAACVRCGVPFASDPDTVASVWVNIETQCPVRPDGTPIVPGEPGTAREPLHDGCAEALQAYGGRPAPVLEQFPHARVDRIRIGGDDG